MEKQEAIIDSDQVKKPRKRFVGRAKKAASNANNEVGGAIEDGAVGFASKVLDIPVPHVCYLHLTLNEQRHQELAVVE